MKKKTISIRISSIVQAQVRRRAQLRGTLRSTAKGTGLKEKREGLGSANNGAASVTRGRLIARRGRDPAHSSGRQRQQPTGLARASRARPERSPRTRDRNCQAPRAPLRILISAGGPHISEPTRGRPNTRTCALLRPARRCSAHRSSGERAPGAIGPAVLRRPRQSSN